MADFTLEEDIFEKVLKTTTQFPNPIKWSNDGKIAVLSKNNVHIYIPTYQPKKVYLSI
jgi:hypothetical protein